MRDPMKDDKYARGLWRLYRDLYPDAAPAEILRLIYLTGVQDRKDEGR